MEKWELIKEITIEETRQNISITEDSNGNPFRLEKVEIFILSMPTEFATAGAISACMTAERANVVQIGSSATSTDTKKYCYGFWEKSGFGIMHRQSLYSINGTTNINGMQQASATCAQVFDDDGADCPEVCEGIWIGSHYQSVLSPGTKIKVFGVKE